MQIVKKQISRKSGKMKLFIKFYGIIVYESRKGGEKMKKLFIFILLLFAAGVYAADLHIAPYSDRALDYAKSGGLNTIILFRDNDAKSYDFAREILNCGQLLAATEGFVWLNAGNDRNIANKFGVNTYPTLLCIDSQGWEVYGTRFSPVPVASNVNLAQTFLLSLVANNLTDWEVRDNWRDSRYDSNRFVDCDINYWSNHHKYIPFKETAVKPQNSVNIGNFLTGLMFLYQMYPALSPIVSDRDNDHRRYYNYRNAAKYRAKPDSRVYVGGHRTYEYRYDDFDREYRNRYEKRPERYRYPDERRPRPKPAPEIRPREPRKTNDSRKPGINDRWNNSGGEYKYRNEKDKHQSSAVFGREERLENLRKGKTEKRKDNSKQTSEKRKEGSSSARPKPSSKTKIK